MGFTIHFRLLLTFAVASHVTATSYSYSASSALHRLSQKDNNVNTDSQKLLADIPVEQQLAVKRYVFSPKVYEFDARHLYNSGKNKDENGNILDSFIEISQKAKQYLIDLSIKIYHGQILPEAWGNKFEEWLDEADSKFVTVIDTDASILANDFRNQFYHFKNVTGMDKRTLNDSFDKNCIPANFTTEKFYKSTHITFRTNNDSSDSVVGLDVTGEQIWSRLTIGTDINGRPIHFEGFSGEQIVTQKQSMGTFSVSELHDIAELRKRIWKEFGITTGVTSTRNESSSTSKIGFVLLEDSTFKMLKEVLDKDYQLKYSSENDSILPPGVCKPVSKCGFTLNQQGEVEAISQKQVLDAYKKLNNLERQKLIEVVRKYRHKIIADGNNFIEESEKFKQILQLEEIKSHNLKVVAVEDLQNFNMPGLDGNHEYWASQLFETVEKQFKTVKTNVKLSQSKISQSLSKLAKSKSEEIIPTTDIDTVNPINKYFLTKTIVSGITSNDSTSLAIVGARTLTSHDLANAGADKLRNYLYSLPRDFGKTSATLGKVAGPISAALDIGLSVWSLAKSIQRLNNETNKYLKYDAIADIVYHSVNIAVTATVTVVANMFPPIAPIAIAVGVIIDLATKLALGLFKAANEVSRINAEIPLLGFEKKNEFKSRFFDIFGTRKPNYVDYLLEEKAANDLAVQHNLKFLEQNQNFLGIVFPSRTLHYDGACYFTGQHCALKNAWGCTKWEPKYTYGTGCDKGRPCPKEICTDFRRPIGKWGYDDYKCVCNGRATTTFGYPRSNSKVDFRSPQNLFWERAVPKDVENAVFKCKPGYSQFIDYKVTQDSSRTDYLCENAIGLLQPHNRRWFGQVMLFDLEDGNDTVWTGRESTPNLFRMGNEGYKDFVGGGGKDEFLFDSSCTSTLRGSINGGLEVDGIIVGGDCAKSETITVDFIRNRIISSRNSLDLSFTDIEEFIGREHNGEIVRVQCNTRKVYGRGGSSIRPDVVTILNDFCTHNVTVFASKYTKITSRAKLGNITIPIERPWVDVSLDLTISSRDDFRASLIFLNATSKDVTRLESELNGRSLKTSVYASREQILLTFHMEPGIDGVSLLFPEEPNGSPFSVLYLSLANNLTSIFFHQLPPLEGQLIRKGCDAVPNVFDIRGGRWNVPGGDLDDEFVLGTKEVGSIDGGLGVDTLKFHPNFTELYSVDLGIAKFTSIERVFGLEGVPLVVKTACDTVVVATLGGSETIPDKIYVPDIFCLNRSLQIISTGHTTVTVGTDTDEQSVSKNDNLFILAHGKPENKLRFTLKTESAQIPNLYVSIVVSHKNWNVSHVEKDYQLQKIFVNLLGYSNVTGNKEWVELELKQDLNTTAVYFDTPVIQVSVENSTDVPGMLIFDKISGYPKMLYDIIDSNDTIPTASLHGFFGIENIFRMSPSNNSRELYGGNKRDLFVFTTDPTTSGHISIHGGNGGDNTLILNDNQNEADAVFVVNLVSNKLGFLYALPSNRGKIENVQHVVGRENAPDIIYPSCNTKSVTGRSGSEDENLRDHIIIGSDSCKFDLVTSVGRFTDVKNIAKAGNFVYHVEDLMTSTLELHTGYENMHLIKMEFNPWHFITAVAFDPARGELGWQLQDNNATRIQAFKMWRSSNQGDYSNPIFEFHPPGSSVSSDIRVTADGVTVATFMVQSNENHVKGLPVDVNVFMVNITSGSNQSIVAIRGCADGSRCNANQFWVFSLEYPLESLDGGKFTNGSGENYLHLLQKFQHSIVADLDINNGAIKTQEGLEIISKLTNIHKFHGTERTTAVVHCDTSQVSNAGSILVKAEPCPLNLIVKLENYTQIWFEDYDPNKFNVSSDNRLDMLRNSTVHYRFARPMSFDPKGGFNAINSHNHNYYLPFTLDALEELYFDIQEDRLYYTIDDVKFNHSMLFGATYSDQFYAQPNMVTEEGFRIQVARDGSIWATLGHTELDITPDIVPELQEIANDLGITMVLSTKTDFYYIGHSAMQTDRNILQTTTNVTNHLAGGGADNTIYEINHLEKDSVIYTGFDQDSYESWLISGNDTKQTIDLTDIVVPIRTKFGNKYIPNVESDGNNLIILMNGHEHIFPGRVIIANGVNQWVAGRIQLLLENSLMDLGPTNQSNGAEYSPANVSNRSTRSLKNSTWSIQPRPVIIPANFAIYSVVADDLEDGHVIQLEIAKNPVISAKNMGTKNINPNFEVARNNTDLFMTNIADLDSEGEHRTIIIGDYFEQQPSHKTQMIFKATRKPINITVHFGLKHFIVNNTGVFHAALGSSPTKDVVEIKDWQQLLNLAENTLLPTTTTTAAPPCTSRRPWWKRVIAFFQKLLFRKDLECSR